MNELRRVQVIIITHIGSIHYRLSTSIKKHVILREKHGRTGQRVEAGQTFRIVSTRVRRKSEGYASYA